MKKGQARKTPGHDDAVAPATGDASPMHVRKLPRHVAIIMDGNGRWAKKRNQVREIGHQRGAMQVKPIVTECVKLGIQALTLYSFSMENWKRPNEEVSSLMDLYCQYLSGERQLMMDENVRLVQLGRREGLPASVLEELDRTVSATAGNTGMTLAVALNYGSRLEIVDAVRAIARKAASGQIKTEEIDESLIDAHLYTAGLPDPDLLIRTAGEMRISNFLLWQISYTELWVTQTLWPDFGIADLHEAIADYGRRQRRFGDVTAE